MIKPIIHIDIELPSKRDRRFEAEIKELNDLVIAVAKACATIICTDSDAITDMKNTYLPREYREYAADKLLEEPALDEMPTFSQFVYHEVFDLHAECQPEYADHIVQRLAESCIYNPAYMRYYADLVLEHCKSALSNEMFTDYAMRFVAGICNYL